MFKSIKSYIEKTLLRKLFFRIYFRYLDRLAEPGKALSYTVRDLDTIKKIFFEEKSSE
jgi:hypothetical protein